MIEYSRKRCKFYYDDRCPITEKYLKLISSGEVTGDLNILRTRLCSQRNLNCETRITLAAGLLEAI